MQVVHAAWLGSEAVDVLLCFSCDELETFRGGKRAGHEDFDPRRADLVKVAKRPRDAGLPACSARTDSASRSSRTCLSQDVPLDDVQHLRAPSGVAAMRDGRR